jgi:hypothetical protein
MLELVRKALRIKTEDFDDEISLLIDDCLSEMTGLGVTGCTAFTQDSQILSAVIAYCKWKFGDSETKDDFERIYHTKVGQLMNMDGYTNWGDVNG